MSFVNFLLVAACAVLHVGGKAQHGRVNNLRNNKATVILGRLIGDTVIPFKQFEVEDGDVVSLPDACASAGKMLMGTLIKGNNDDPNDAPTLRAKDLAFPLSDVEVNCPYDGCSDGITLESYQYCHDYFPKEKFDSVLQGKRRNLKSRL